ncbi:MAG: cytochrome c, partial [Pseudomonadota bacterium]|nr:cytochrome c [Pseudomonadota bacterium]
MKTALKLWSLTFLLSSTVLSGQELKQASFSADQAARGSELYQQNCAACHLANLTGSFEAPNLADTGFRSNWANRRVDEFVEMLQRTMPPQAPGSLAQSQYLDISAFLLEANNISASATALSLSAGSVLFLDNKAGAARVLERRTPVPGLAGTVPSPGTRNSVPEIATIYQSERARTRSFESVNKFRNVSNEELANPPAADWTYWRRSPQSQG